MNRIISIIGILAFASITCLANETDSEREGGVLGDAKTIRNSGTIYGAWVVFPHGAISTPVGINDSSLAIRCVDNGTKSVILHFEHPFEDGSREFADVTYTIGGVAYVYSAWMRARAFEGQGSESRWLTFDKPAVFIEILKTADGPAFFEVVLKGARLRLDFDASRFSEALASMERHPKCWVGR